MVTGDTETHLDKEPFSHFQVLLRLTCQLYLSIFFLRVSGLVKLSELKGSLTVGTLPVSDSMMTQREGGACEEAEKKEEQEAATAVRKRSRKSVATDGAEVKVRGRRQKDFDSTVGDEEEAEPQESKERLGPAVWTQNQQKLLELALQQFPRGTAERWDHIAKVVPGKTKVGTEMGDL